jgi:hypothetical protein
MNKPARLLVKRDPSSQIVFILYKVVAFHVHDERARSTFNAMCCQIAEFPNTTSYPSMQPLS